jgi:opacity protein-like surface antigen
MRKRKSEKKARPAPRRRREADKHLLGYRPLGGHVAKALLIMGCLVGLLVAAAPAAADSIVFVKDGNVWLANPDGSGQYQVTGDGTAAQPWRSPSQADDGTIAAGFGNEIVRMRQNGEVLNRIDPPALLDSAGDPVDGPPINVAISPDGARIAYTIADYACPVGADCDTRTVTAYTAADRLTPATVGGTTYLRNPSWATNSRTLQFGGYEHQVDLHDFGAGADAHWFDDADVVGQPAATDLGDGELNRLGTRLALIRGYGEDASVVWYEIDGDALGGLPPAPTPLCFSGADPGIHGPTWSPDGASVAFADPDGIWVKRAADDCEYPQPALAVPGGSQPDWGPAAVAPEPRTAPHADPTSHGGATSHGGRARAIHRCRKLKHRKARARCIRRARGHGAKRVLTSTAR